MIKSNILRNHSGSAPGEDQLAMLYIENFTRVVLLLNCIFMVVEVEHFFNRKYYVVTDGMMTFGTSNQVFYYTLIIFISCIRNLIVREHITCRVIFCTGTL